jgi:hypothetical protein
MTTLTIELPDNLSHQIHARGISQQSLKEILIRELQVFLREEATNQDKVSSTSTFPIDNESFARHKVANHRDVSEPKAQVYCYPTVSVPLSSLDGLIDIMPGIEGDALADTEALYDEV